MRTWKKWMMAALVGGTMASGTRAVRAQTTDDKIDALDQKVKVLERKLELADEDAKTKAKDATVVKADKDGFSIASGDGAFKLKLRGYVQADGRFYADDSDKKVADTFLLRRARPIVDGTLYDQFEFRIMPDFGGGSTVLYDAYIDYKPAALANLRVGKFKVPFGIEQYQSDTDIPFVERGLPSDLEPNRDEGVELYGDIGSNALVYTLGVFNGTPDGSNGDADSNDGKDVAGRIFLQPFKNSGIDAVSGLGFGIAASSGDETGTGSAPGLPSFKTIGQQTFFSYKTSTTNANDNVIADGTHTRFSPQASYYVGPVGLVGEYVQSSQDVKIGAKEETLDNNSWQAIGSIVLTGEKASPKGVVPLAPFDPSHGAWGAFELVGRYGELNVDDSAFSTYADPKKSAKSVAAWGVGINWYLNKSVKFVVDYDQSQFDGGDSSGDRPDEKVVMTRLQLAY